MKLGPINNDTPVRRSQDVRRKTYLHTQLCTPLSGVNRSYGSRHRTVIHLQVYHMGSVAAPRVRPHCVHLRWSHFLRQGCVYLPLTETSKVGLIMRVWNYSQMTKKHIYKVSWKGNVTNDKVRARATTKHREHSQWKIRSSDTDGPPAVTAASII